MLAERGETYTSPIIYPRKSNHTGTGPVSSVAIPQNQTTNQLKQTNRIYIKHVWMSFDLEKCTRLIMKKVKRETTEAAGQINQKSIRWPEERNIRDEIHETSGLKKKIGIPQHNKKTSQKSIQRNN